MRLSFREQAAIALRAQPQINGNAPSDSDPRYSLDAEDACTEAQLLANACCVKWGHDWQPLAPHGEWRAPGVALQGDGAQCCRCGAKEER